MKHQQHHRPRAATPAARTTLAAALTLAMPILAAQPAFAQPGLVVDPNAANRPGITNGPNGTPIVGINAPDAAGISANRFTEYNVGPAGLVLNNSVNGTNTQLAGSIDGNARLGGRSAQVILNQVTGGNASVLAGATEVAGQQARVIVANPNGISVNGASFINASRASLVAGTTEFDEDGRIARFRTENGRIAIDGAGLDARNMDQLDLVSRGLKVDAAVRAKKLVAIAHQGTAAIEQSNRQTLSGSASGKAPAAAIDVSESGSLRADEIALIGASAKTGVRIAGTVDADTVDVSGRLDNDGSVRGRSVRIAGDATNSGTLHAEKLLAMGNVTNGGTIEAGDVQVMGNTTNNGALRAKKLFSTSGNMTNRGTIEGGDVKVMGNTTNDGTLRAEKLLSAMGNVTNRGTIEAGAVKVMGKVTNDGTLHGDDSVSVMGRLYNGLSGVTSSYGNVFGAGRVSGPGRIVSYMVRPTPAGDVR